MQYFVVTRFRCIIDAKYIESILGNAVRGTPDHRVWTDIHGPYFTLEEAKATFDDIKNHVDDDDYGIFALDDSGWWRIPWGNPDYMIRI